MNSDGVIDEDDKTYSGTGIAKVEANLNLGASYKGFDFSAVIGSAFGNKIYNGIRYYYEGMNSTILQLPQEYPQCLDSYQHQDRAFHVPSMVTLTRTPRVNPLPGERRFRTSAPGTVGLYLANIALLSEDLLRPHPFLRECRKRVYHHRLFWCQPRVLTGRFEQWYRPLYPSVLSPYTVGAQVSF